jgi:glycosyltransferase involved in cell wall biosynthesis
MMNWRDRTNPSAGGAELVTHEIAKRWTRQGNQVRLLTSMYPHARKEEVIDGVAVTRIGGKYSVYVACASYFLRHHSQYCDVVVDEINSFPFLTPLYCREPTVPLVFQMTREIYHRHLPELVSSVAMNVETQLLRLYAKSPTIVLSDSTKQDLISIGFQSNRVFVCPPGVDHEHFATGEKSPSPIVLYLSRFTKYKNPDHLMIAFKEVLAAAPDCELVMAGAGNDAQTRAYERLAETLGIRASVKILPFVRGAEKLELLQRAWVHVLPSIREGWGISILEAGACGTPTVAYNVSGVRDAVQHMKTGILVPRNSIESMAEAIITILRDNKLRKSLSAAAVEWASKYTWDSTAERAMGALSEARALVH